MEENVSIMAYVNLFDNNFSNNRYMLKNYYLDGDIYTLYTRDGYVFEVDKSNVVIRKFSK